MITQDGYVCDFCGWEYSRDEELEKDHLGQGFWCEMCDSYTYIIDGAERNRFKLLLEQKGKEESTAEALRVKFPKRLSPFRYPGGKSKVIDQLFTRLNPDKTDLLVSPYTGGASFELAMLASGVVKSLHLNDLDFGIYSFWLLVKNDPESLLRRIQNCTPTHEMFFELQDLILSGYQNSSHLDAAWASLVVNRLAYSGIVKANPIGGKNGSQKRLLVRWNPTTLVKRIKCIHQMGPKIEVTNLDALEVIEEAYWNDRATIFIDPPYVQKGKSLYPHYYEEEDHIALACLLESLYTGFPGADILVTYDYTQWLDELYTIPEKEFLERAYSA